MKRKKSLPAFDPAKFEKMSPPEKLEYLNALIEALNESLALRNAKSTGPDTRKKNV